MTVSFSNKGNRKWSFLTTSLLHKTYFFAVSWNEPQRDQTKLMLCQTFQRNFSNSLFWSLGNRALMRWKQAEGFSLLHCCAYVTSVSNHLIPQMLKNAEAKKNVFYHHNALPRATMSLLLLLVLWVLISNFFLTPKKSAAVQEKTSWSSTPVPWGLSFHHECFSAVHFNTMFPFLKYLSQTGFHAICFDGVIQQIIPYVAHYILS